MTHVKKLVVNGFKSFAKNTEIPFDTGINIIVGPNGSGKSNISDALCFVLGRMSAKSMRAAKSKNLLFMGSKLTKPAKEASVEIVFDNSKNTFNIPHEEISLKRIVKTNGAGVYKINNETKTRAEIVETLAQAGIDSHGFNLVLQGQIQSIVKMRSEDRRKIIEDVAGISVYESRKEKSLKELEKTDMRLKEISAVVRERTAYLRNLEKERAQALRFQELEKSIKRCKLSLIQKKIDEKSKELESLKGSIDSKTKLKNVQKDDVEKIQENIDSLNERVNQISKHVQKATGLEQSTLKESISNLRAEIEGLRVRKENFENRKKEIENRISKNKEEIPSLEKEIEELKNESPLVAKKQEELKKKKQELENLEEEKKKMYSLKTELNSLKERMKEKENRATKISAESDSLLKRVEELSSDLKFNDYESCLEELNRARESIKGLESELEVVSSKELEMEKIISVSETKISEAEKVKGQIQDIDTCPLCQNKMTEEHSTHVNSDSNKKISEAQKEKDESEKEIESLLNHKQELSKKIFLLKNNLQIYESELPKHNAVIDKQEYVKKLVEEEKILKDEINNLANRRSSLETKSVDSNQIEERYGNKLREIEEISSRTEKDLDQTLMFKNRDLESTKDIIKRGIKDLEEITIEISELSESLESKSNSLKLKEEDEEKLNEKFKKMFEERDLLQTKIHEESMNLSEVQNYCRQIEDQLNDQSLMNARLKAQKEAFEMDLPEFDGVEIIQASKHVLEEKLQKSQAKIQGIGSINMRALEVYGDIKKEYDRVTEKVETLEREKEQIMKIIEEIDRKKKRTFMRTFRGINDLFSSIFSDLCMKGKAYLEIENKDDIFSGGVNIIIKLAKGKYFDVTSLSGGEQSLIALSLLFAIQEFKPYHFYIFDEIDAALDKRNSERLASRLKKYMKSGQYIIVTHNDAIISDSDTLYGVSMHEGVSKVLSIKV